jgi:hypothetical protein
MANQTVQQSTMLLSHQQQQHRILQANSQNPNQNNSDSISVPLSPAQVNKSIPNTTNKSEPVSPLKPYSTPVAHEPLSKKNTLTNLDLNNNNNSSNLSVKNENSILTATSPSQVQHNNSLILNSRGASVHNAMSSSLTTSQQLKLNNSLRNPQNHSLNSNPTVQHPNQSNQQQQPQHQQPGVNNTELSSTSLSPSTTSYTRTHTPTNDTNLANSCKRPRLQINDDEQATWIASNHS